MTWSRNEVRTVNLTGCVSSRDESDLQTKTKVTRETLGELIRGTPRRTLKVYHETVTLLLVTLRSQS